MRINSLLATIVFALTIAGCGDEEPGFLKGDIVGRVGYYEPNYFNWVDSLGGVNVKLVSEDGTQYEFTTPSNGWYRFTDIKAGVYHISFDKPELELNSFVDYSRLNRNSVLHLGGGVTVVNDNYLIQRPMFKVTLLSYVWEGNDVTLTASMGDIDGDRFDFLIFFSDDPSVSANNYIVDTDTRFDNPPQISETASGEKIVKFKTRLSLPRKYVIVYPYSIWNTRVMGQPSNVLHIPL